MRRTLIEVGLKRGSYWNLGLKDMWPTSKGQAPGQSVLKDEAMKRDTVDSLRILFPIGSY